MHTTLVRRAIPETAALLSEEIHPVLDRIYRARNITSLTDLDYSLGGLHKFDLLSGIDAAVKLLKQSLDLQKRVLVIGDFDADGATSSALGVRALCLFGFEQVKYLVPNRFDFGYGLTPEIVSVAADYNPHLIITVDNGISSIEGVSSAHKRNIKVLVTDHHLPGAQIPAADAIVNPNLPGDRFPSKSLAGVGTIFYLMLAFRCYLREQNYFIKHNIQEPNLAELLDLVALGTVADVVPLDKNNRVLVAQGIARIRAGKCCLGIKAITKVSGRNLEQLTSADLGFAIGPRINAAGRIEDMSIGVECLLTENSQKALELAARLDALNRERKEIEADMKQQALEIIDSIHLNGDAQLPVGICLYDAGWHQGVIGILASRIKDKYHRPVIAFADSGEDQATGQAIIKGSARSIPGIHIRDVLDSVATHNPGILKKFGGHAMAAGMSIELKDFQQFSKAFNDEVNKLLDSDSLKNVLFTDGELKETQINLELAELIRYAGPWGQGFPEPLFDGEFEVLQRRIIGDCHLKFLVKIPQGQKKIDALAFFVSDIHWLEGIKKIRMAYTLDINEYNGLRSVQFIIRHAEASPDIS